MDVSAGAEVAGTGTVASGEASIGATGAAGAQEAVSSTATSPKARKKKRGFIKSPY